MVVLSSKIFKSCNSSHRPTLITKCPYVPQQNGCDERKHRHLTETGLAMLFGANADATLWVDVYSSAAFIINRLPTKIFDGKTSFKILLHSTPIYNNFNVFGCRVFPQLY